MIKEVDGRNLQGNDFGNFVLLIHIVNCYFAGLPHEAVAKFMAERFAKRDCAEMTLVVMDYKMKPGEKRRMRRYP